MSRSAALRWATIGSSAAAIAAASTIAAGVFSHSRGHNYGGCPDQRGDVVRYLTSLADNHVISGMHDKEPIPRSK